MEWPKLKNIIIIMLAAVNLLLLVLVFHRQWESERLAGQAREDAIAVLWENSQIKLDGDILPEEMVLPALSVSQDPELERAQAAALLGELYGTPEDSMRYTGEKGTAQFYADGEFSAEFNEGAYPLDGREPGAFAVELLAAMSFDAEILDAGDGGGDAVVTARQLWNGAPVFDCTAELVFRDGELREIRRSVSHRLVGVPQAVSSEECRDLVTLLLRFMEYVRQKSQVCDKITGFTAGYSLDAAQSGPAVQLVPTWRVTTTGPQNIVYYWNALTGEIRAEEPLAD